MFKNQTLLKYLSFGLLLTLVCLLIVGSILEKFLGTALVCRTVYASPVTLVLWSAMALFALLYLFSRRVQRSAVTLALHLSFLLILGGALVTHLFGLQGRVHLRQDSPATGVYQLSDSSEARFPFQIRLDAFDLQYYDGTFSPMDYVSHIRLISPDGHETTADVSMNHICTYRHYRFYQSGYDPDRQGTILSVSYDPYGIAITYTGYLCLLISMIGFFVQKRSRFRALLHHPALKHSALTILLLVGALASAPAPVQAAPDSDQPLPQVLPREVAEAFGDLYIYYNDRICPVQTVAKDFTVKLCGRSTYRGLTAEQVLTGWFFFYDDWKNCPIIRIKDHTTQQLLGISGQYARLTDYIGAGGYKLESALQNSHHDGVIAANEKFNLVSMACTGSLLRIYPYQLATDANPVWYSLADKLPADIPSDEWLFIRKSMGYVAEKVAMQRYTEVVSLVGKIRKYQIREGGHLPSDAKIRAEKFYNASNFNRPLAMAYAALGLLFFVLYCRRFLRRQRVDSLRRPLSLLLGLLSLYLTVHLVLRGYISGHLPLSDGFETMLFMAWCTTLLALILQRRFTFSLPFGSLIAGLSMLVAMMGESNPRITQLIPVLQSPLLSIHVVVIMLAYSLLAFVMLNGVTALTLHASRKDCSQQISYLTVVSQILLYPAVFLLTVGIFVGAVWANVSWGRYWGWDPKEVWALITMLVYSLALHPSLTWFRKPVVFHTFCVVAFLTVLITYFGVNFLLGGKHSYA